MSVPTVVGSSTQSTAFLTRATAARGGVSLSASDAQAADSLITGLVNDGIWSFLSAMYVMNIADSATALLNWVSSSNSLTSTGSPAFTPYRGFACGSGAYLNGPSLSGLSGFSQNSGHVSVWENGGRGRTDDEPAISVAGDAILSGKFGGQAYGKLNASTNSLGAYCPLSASPGLTVISRNSASSETVTAFASPAGSFLSSTDTTTSVAPTATAITISPASSTGAAVLVGAVTIGGGLVSDQAYALNYRLATYMSALNHS